MVRIRVPRNNGEVDGFLESVHDAFAAENEIMFGDGRVFGPEFSLVESHTIAARILCGFDGRSLWAPTEGRPVTVKSRTTKSGVGLYIGRPKIRGKGKFRKSLKDILETGKAVTFGGEAHTGIVDAFKSEVVLRYITNTFISTMENGELPPWRRPWKVRRPTSFATGKPYRGVNAFRLAQVAQEREYVSPLWITAGRAEKEGHPVKSGESGTMIVCPIFNDGDERTNIRDDDEGDDYEDVAPPKGFFCIPVFNLNQCEGMKGSTRGGARRRGAQSIIDGYVNREKRYAPTKTLNFDKRGNGRASYTPSKDRILVPRTSRTSESEYYIRAFHQIAHSTGHPNRCDRRDRDRQAPLGNHKPGKEELIAEMTASLLSAETTLEFNGAWGRNTASDREDWLRVIRRDLIWASFQATTAVEYILDRGGARKEILESKERKQARAKKKGNRKASARKRR